VARSPFLVRSPATLRRDGPFGVVLLAPRDAEPRALAGSAVVVWEALAEPVSRGDLVADLAAAFGADPATVAADVAPLLDALLASGAVVET
jgi:hypothetical protein